MREYFRAKLLRQHARHPAAHSADWRSARVPHAPCPGGDALVRLRHLQRLSSWPKTVRAVWPAPPSTTGLRDVPAQVWDWDRPGNIVEDVRAGQPHPSRESGSPAVDQPALLRLRQRPTDGLRQATRDGSNVILCVVNVDPFWPQAGWLNVPVSEWGIGGEASVRGPRSHDGERYTWRGNYKLGAPRPERPACGTSSASRSRVLSPHQVMIDQCARRGGSAEEPRPFATTRVLDRACWADDADLWLVGVDYGGRIARNVLLADRLEEAFVQRALLRQFHGGQVATEGGGALVFSTYAPVRSHRP